MTQWISVKDRLPELKETMMQGHYESDWVLVTHKPNDSCMGAPSPWIAFMHRLPKRKKAEWTFMGDASIGKVTHWMMLPEPPNDN